MIRFFVFKESEQPRFHQIEPDTWARTSSGLFHVRKGSDPIYTSPDLLDAACSAYYASRVLGRYYSGPARRNVTESMMLEHGVPVLKRTSDGVDMYKSFRGELTSEWCSDLGWMLRNLWPGEELLGFEGGKDISHLCNTGLATSLYKRITFDFSAQMSEKILNGERAEVLMVEQLSSLTQWTTTAVEALSEILGVERGALFAKMGEILAEDP